MSNPRRIDTHQHFVPADYSTWMHEKGVHSGGVPLPEWSEKHALSFMDHHGIRTGILSLSTPGVWFGNDAEARHWARRINEYGAEVVHKRPDRLGYFATLTLPDVDGSFEEARYAFDVLHADGVVLLAGNDGRYLGDPAFEPLLAFLDEREAVVFIHPGELPGPLADGIPSFTADFLLDTSRTVISLILSGAMDRFPRIKFLLAHAGGFIPYIEYRVMLTMMNEKSKVGQAAAFMRRRRELPRMLEVFKHFYYDVALSATPAALPSLLAVAAPDHITYGSDFPFAPAPAVTVINEAYEHYKLTRTQRRAIDRGTSELLFPRLAG